MDPLNTEGYSIRCDVNGDNELHFIKFFYDGIVQDEFGLPRYMSGDSDSGAFINKADYISTCGLKTIKIEGHVWDSKCFENEFVIDVANSDGTPCGAKPPTAAPVQPTTAAPAKPETRAPVPAPVRKPVAPPVKSDPVPTPVAKPTPTCPHPKVWINGCCKDPTPTCAYPKQLIDGVCKDVCTNSYVCPANSCRIAHRLCYDNFDDCICDSAYKKKGNVCVRKCDYVCPLYSERKPNRGCYDNFDDCECDDGYDKSGSYCEKEDED